MPQPSKFTPDFHSGPRSAGSVSKWKCRFHSPHGQQQFATCVHACATCTPGAPSERRTPSPSCRTARCVFLGGTNREPLQEPLRCTWRETVVRSKESKACGCGEIGRSSWI